MNILYIHQYFITPKEPGPTRSYWVARELIKSGHKVTMLTTSSTVKSNKDRGRVLIDGIDVIYLNIPYHGSMSVKSRLMAFLKFAYQSSLFVLKQKNIDLVIATSTPLTVGIPALLGKWFRRFPFIFEVRDLWPEVPIQMGGLQNKFAIKAARLLEETIYVNATHIIALSPGMMDGVLSKGISPSKVNMIPNMSKPDVFWPRPKNTELMEKLRLKEDTFKVIYFGALGLANALDYIVQAAEILKYDQRIEFIFAGGGGVEEDLKQQCKDLQLTNVRILGNFPMSTLSEIVNLADVSLVTFKNLPILATNSPNKLFDSLSAGKPIIVNSAGWTKSMVEEYQCGFYVHPEQPEDLVRSIITLLEDSELCARMGERSRWLSEKKFDKSILCDQFVATVNSISDSDPQHATY
ncbi:glycosyltransferase WbuB [Robertkochia marina]|uniref:Glycosyltransferase WbuB n=1 Tax=Robertkochia marina TaxID=1227945 RepID=A0A4S3LZQ6_9FLAO|nr:glycosyltransferase family 4 protein [Robertkochia marina]THD66795.1 glycosyltransferase WbuB [Robertkochia marina]TRZ41914.1 glycosyltransferase WbuB [Robertkochia marina]